MHRVALAWLVLALVACGPRPRPRPVDPKACESDPDCAAKQRMYDCSRECSDDPACVDRCREINITAGHTGR